MFPDRVRYFLHGSGALIVFGQSRVIQEIPIISITPCSFSSFCFFSLARGYRSCLSICDGRDCGI